MSPISPKKSSSMEIEKPVQPETKLYDLLNLQEPINSNGNNSSGKMVNELSSSNSYSNIEVEDLEINPNKIDELFLSNETRQKIQSQPLHIKTANSFPELIGLTVLIWSFPLRAQIIRRSRSEL